MRVPRFKSARIAVKRFRSRRRAEGVILGYHRIGDSSWDPFGLSVSPRNFGEQLDILRRYANPMAVAELTGSHSHRRTPRPVGVTFDDGYLACLSMVKPLLESSEVPATVFVITGWLGRELWWDRLARALAPSQELPDRLSLATRGKEHTWDLAQYQGPEARRALAWELHRLLAQLPPGERTSRLTEITRSVEIPEETETDHRCLTQAELLQLTAGGLIQVGAHTANHEPLGRLSSQAQRVEIETSKAMLEENLGQPIQGFSYPHGSLNREVRRQVRQAGFAYACSSRRGAVFATSDPFDLPRLWVPNLDGDGFRRWFQGWIGKGS